MDFGGPLHSLVLCGHMHELERALFDHYRWKGDGPTWVKPQPARRRGSDSSDDSGSDGDQ